MAWKAARPATMRQASCTLRAHAVGAAWCIISVAAADGPIDCRAPIIRAIIRRSTGCSSGWRKRTRAPRASLRGNALLKWLAARGASAADTIRATVAVSAPVDLQIAGHGLGRGINRLYTWHFLSSLKPKS